MKRTLAILLVAIMLLGVVSASAETMFPWKEEGITLTIGIPSNNNVSDYVDNYYVKYLKEQTGINVEFVLYPSADATTKLKMQVNSGESLPDILGFGIDQTTAYEWGRQGILLPMNDWYKNNGANFYAYCESVGLDGNEVLGSSMSPDGNIYAAPYFSYSYGNTMNQRAYINKTWLDKVGKKMPTNKDELYDVLVAFRDQDPNGNGIKDEIPMLGRSASGSDDPLDWLQQMFIYCQRDSYYTKEVGFYLPLSDTNGVLDVSYDKDEYRQFLVYAHQLIKEGLLSSLSFTIDASQMTALERAQPCQVGIFCAAHDTSNLLPSVVGDEYVPIETLFGIDGTRRQAIAPPTGKPYISVTKYCEHPEAAMALINLMYDEAGVDLARVQRYGEKGVDWRPYDPEIDTDLQSPYDDFAPATIVLQNQWGVLSNKLVQRHVLSYVGDPGLWITGLREGEVTAGALEAESYNLNKKYCPDFSDIVSDSSFLYTEEEDEEWNDMRSALRTYVGEARVLFALGELDPNNDSDWKNYLDTLNDMQYQDIIELSRTAYARKQEALKK